jgi:hypothetical protein
LPEVVSRVWRFFNEDAVLEASVYAPERRRKTITFVAGVHQSRTTAPSVIDGAMNGPVFVGYVEQILARRL